MADATRLAGDSEQTQGLRVTTESSGNEYVYELRETEDGSEEYECISKQVFYDDGGSEDLEPEVTEAVESAVEDLGLAVA